MIEEINIQGKIEEYEKAKANYVAQVNACNGALQALRELLKDKTEEGGKT